MVSNVLIFERWNLEVEIWVNEHQADIYQQVRVVTVLQQGKEMYTNIYRFQLWLFHITW